MARSDDVDDRLADLERTLDDLRADLEPRGPFGLPRPPTPGEVLRFTGEYTIPTAIATLEAQIRALELLGAVLRRLGPRTERSDGVARERAERVGDAVLGRLDETLDDLQRAVEEGSLPADPTARRLLTEARRLNADLQEEMRAGDDGRSGADADRGVDIAVEEELRTIKDSLDDETDARDDQTGSNR